VYVAKYKSQMITTSVIECSALSEIGPVRQDNQDAVYLPSQTQSEDLRHLFAVADGMGGYSHGGLASSLALQVLTTELLNAASINPKSIRQSIENANLGVYKTAQKLGVGRMGTTLTAACIVGEMAYLAHVGDSRAYLIRNERVTCLTADHTTVGDLVRAKLISADKIRTHAQRSILTKAVGLGLFIQPDITNFRLQEGDRIILCSDGLWSLIQDHEFASIGRNSSPQETSRCLVDIALNRETDDNASVVVFDIRKFSKIASREEPVEKNFFKSLIRKWAR